MLKYLRLNSVTSKPRRFRLYKNWKEREGGGMEGRIQ